MLLKQSLNIEKSSCKKLHTAINSQTLNFRLPSIQPVKIFGEIPVSLHIKLCLIFLSSKIFLIKLSGSFSFFIQMPNNESFSATENILKTD